jgi:starch synthase
MGDDGWGIRFEQPTAGDVTYSVGRAVDLYTDQNKVEDMQKTMMHIDHSWENTVQQYIELYNSLK